MSRRPRGRGRKPQNKNNNPNRALDSNGPDVRVRGSAKTIYEKYVSLARDASASGGRVKAENYLQHAEHYYRIMQDLQAAAEARAEKQAEDMRQRQAAKDASREAAKQKKPASEDAEGPENSQATADKDEKQNGRSRSYLSRRRQKPAKHTDDAADLAASEAPQKKTAEAVVAAAPEAVADI